MSSTPGRSATRYCGKYYQDGDELESHAPSRFSDSVIFLADRRLKLSSPLSYIPRRRPCAGVVPPIAELRAKARNMESTVLRSPRKSKPQISSSCFARARTPARGLKRAPPENTVFFMSQLDFVPVADDGMSHDIDNETVYNYLIGGVVRGAL